MSEWRRVGGIRDRRVVQPLRPSRPVIRLAVALLHEVKHWRAEKECRLSTLPSLTLSCHLPGKGNTVDSSTSYPSAS